MAIITVALSTETSRRLESLKQMTTSTTAEVITKALERYQESLATEAIPSPQAYDHARHSG